MDFAALEPMDDEHVRLVFWEAKDFRNGELVAKTENVPVLAQIARYKQVIARKRAEVEASYQRVIKNLVAIKDFGWRRPLSPLFKEVESGRKALTLGPHPKVGLIIFGFDAPQRDHPVWQKHLQRLRDGTEVVRAAGKAEDIRLWP